jgi:uncharacterized membrane protein YeaQ/YmgE (transglycosylase-associated protein family)
MEMIVGLVVVLALLVFGFAMLGMAIKLVWALAVGLIIGTLAKVVLPGRQDLGWTGTALAGIAGSLIGGMLAHRVLHVGGLGSLILTVLCAAGLVTLLSGQKRLP